MIEPKVRFRILNDSQQHRIHQATMKVLKETGCEFRHERALEILKSAGARTDGVRVRIGEDLVEEALRRAPKEIVLGDREGKPAMRLSGDRVHYGTGSDCLYVLEGETRRRAVLEDVRRFARLTDALDEIDFAMSMACPSDVSDDRLYREQFAAMLAETSKPKVFTVIDPGELDPILRMCVAAQGSVGAHNRAPHLLLYAEPVSPLVHPRTSVEKLFFCAQHGVPVTYSPGSMGGATLPIMGAGAVVQSAAEILSGLVLSQFAKAGAPFVFGGSIGPMDMHTMVNVYCAPFGATWTVALVEMGKRYGLPTWSLAGCSDSKRIDAQAGIDASLMTLAAALNGANLVHDVGYIESGMTSSLEMTAIAAEVIAVVGRMVEGIDASDESLALDAIDRVGPGGHFLVDEHTVAHFRAEQFQPRLMDYQAHPAWQSSGSATMIDRARRRVDELLSRGGSPLDDARREAVEAILRE